MDHRYSGEVCSVCGDPWCAGCEHADVDRDEPTSAEPLTHRPFCRPPYQIDMDGPICRPLADAEYAAVKARNKGYRPRHRGPKMSHG